MKIRFADLWRPSGTMNRGTYALVGLLGFALKHNLDRLVATCGFHRPWGFFNYWVPVRHVARITQLRSDEAVFLETMLALALPFVWIGVMMTLKRLRSAKLPTELVVLFFIPFLNLVFFLLLCLVPEKDLPSDKRETEHPNGSYLARIVPESALGSAAISLLFTVPVGLGMVLLGAQMLTNYGWGLFIAVPFTIGFAAALIDGIRQPRSLGSCISVACISITLLGVALLALAIEGMFCLLMAMPIALPLAALAGTWCSGGAGSPRTPPPSWPSCSSLSPECSG